MLPHCRKEMARVEQKRTRKVWQNPKGGTMNIPKTHLYRVEFTQYEYINAESEEDAIEKVCKYHRIEPDSVTEVESDD